MDLVAFPSSVGEDALRRGFRLFFVARVSSPGLATFVVEPFSRGEAPLTWSFSASARFSWTEYSFAAVFEPWYFDLGSFATSGPLGG